jgi:hypothetical protein
MIGFIIIAAVCGFIVGFTTAQKIQEAKVKKFIDTFEDELLKAFAANKKEYAKDAGEDWDGQ